MSSPLDSLLESVKTSIVNHLQSNGGGHIDTGGLFGKLTDLFGQHKQATGGDRQVTPASHDPYGDPAGSGGGPSNVKPASSDPYGDPADQAPRR